MNKTSITALVVAIIALVLGGYSLIDHAPKLGSYVPPVQSASGFSQSIATSTTLGAICATTNIQFLGGPAGVTTTLPTAASTSVCTSLQNAGASISGLFVNDSTNTVAFATSTGTSIKCETAGVGTSTVTGGCTSAAFSILASTTVQFTEYFDTVSSTLVFLVGNNFK